MNTRLTLLGSAIFALALLASPVRADDGESCPGCPSKKPKETPSAQVMQVESCDTCGCKDKKKKEGDCEPAKPTAAVQGDDCDKDCGKKKCDEPKTSVEQGDCDDCGCKKKGKGKKAPAEAAPAA